MNRVYANDTPNGAEGQGGLEASLFGLSMGGWFCLRAAAFEPRIRNVICRIGNIGLMLDDCIAWLNGLDGA